MVMKKIFLLSVFVTVLICTALALPSLLVKAGNGRIDTVGLNTTIEITLNEAPYGLSGYILNISLSNPSVAEIISVSFPDWAILHDNSSLPADSIQIKAVDLKDQIKVNSTSIDLVTIMFRGDAQGETDIIVKVIKMDDDRGDPVNPSTENGHLSIGSITLTTQTTETLTTTSTTSIITTSAMTTRSFTITSPITTSAPTITYTTFKEYMTRLTQTITIVEKRVSLISIISVLVIISIFTAIISILLLIIFRKGRRKPIVIGVKQS